MDEAAIGSNIGNFNAYRKKSIQQTQGSNVDQSSPACKRMPKATKKMGLKGMDLIIIYSNS
jgi:hypothetical protein